MKTYSKISNKNVIGLRVRIIGLLILLHLPVFFLLCFLKINLDFKEELGLVLAVTFLILVIFYYRSRYFELDSSGEVISIRSYHPTFKSFERRSEFPKQKMQDYKVEKNLGGADLKINLKMADQKSTTVKFSIQGFSLNQVHKLEKSLQKTKDKYKDESSLFVSDSV